jgi:two-component system LytT family sensor kinase
MTLALAHADLLARQIRRDRAGRGRSTAAALFVMAGMALIVEVVAHRYTPAGAQSIVASAAGLLAGPVVGIAVGLGATLMGLTLPAAQAIGGLGAFAGGVAGGMLHLVWPGWARRPAVGFALGVTTAAFSQWLLDPAGMGRAAGMVAIGFGGLGVALVLAVVSEVRAREAEAQATTLAEIRSLQARMNPHFLFNALNTIAALSVVSPALVPGAVSRLGTFLRWGLDRHDRATVPLGEELEIVGAYLDIESLRLGSRLDVERVIEPEALCASIPPLSLQPLVENAIVHGIGPSPGGGKIRLEARVRGGELTLIVSDTGVGLPGNLAVWHAPCHEDGTVHALELLMRRLDALYPREYGLEVRRNPHGGTTATLRIPAGLVADAGSKS